MEAVDQTDFLGFRLRRGREKRARITSRRVGRQRSREKEIRLGRKEPAPAQDGRCDNLSRSNKEVLHVRLATARR